MRRLALIAALLLLARGARAGTSICPGNLDCNGHVGYGFGDPTTAPTPATAVVRLGDFPQGGTPCVLQAPGANGKPVCATVAGFTVLGAPLQLSGTTLSFLWDNSSLTLNGGGGLQRAAITGVVLANAGNNTTTYPNAAALSVLVNAGSGAAPPSFLAAGSAGQSLMVNGAGTALAWQFTPSSSVSGTADTMPYFDAAGVLTEGAAAWSVDPAHIRWGSRISSGLPLYQLHVVDEAGAADRGATLATYQTGTLGPLLTLQAAQGTLASPTAVDATKYGGRLAWQLHDGTNFVETGKIFTHVTPGATVGTGSVPTDVAIQSTQAGAALVDPYSGSGASVGLLLRGTQVAFGVNPSAAALATFSNVFGGSSTVFGSNAGAVVYAPGNFGNSGVQVNNAQILTMLNSSMPAGAPSTLWRSARSLGNNAAPTAVVGGTQLGGSGFYGYDGSTYSQGVAVTAFVDFNSTVTTGRVPTNWGVFSNDGSTLPGLFHGYFDDVVAGSWSQLATNSTQGFFWAASAPGVPTGTPVVPQISAAGAAITNAVPLVPDRTHARLYGYFGHWAPIGQDTTALASGFLKNTTSTGVWTVDTATYTPTTRTVQGTSPILIAGGTSAVDLSVNRVWSLAANGVTYSFLQQGAALSIPGRASNSSGTWADIAAAAGGNGVFRESGSTLGFGSIVESSVTNLITDLAGKQATGNYVTAGTGPVTFAGPGSAATAINFAGGSISGILALANEGSPTGTGFAHVTSGTWDGAARAVNLAGADVTGLLPAASLGAGTNGQVLTTVGGVSTWAAGSSSGADALGTYFVASSSHAPANAVNFGLLTTGIVKITVSGASATPSIAAGGTDFEFPLTFSTGLHRSTNTITADLSTGVAGGQTEFGGTGNGESITIQSTTAGTKGPIKFGASGSIGVLDEVSGKQSWGQTSLDARAHFVTTDDTSPTPLTAWDGRHVVFGASSSTGAGIGFSHDATSGTGEVFFAKPNVAWENAALRASTFAFYSNGTTLGLSQDVSGNVAVATLGAGGIVNATTSTGGLTVATPAQVAAAQTWPAANDALVSSGPSTAPIGYSTFTVDPSTHAVNLDGLVVNGASNFPNTYFIGGPDTNGNRDRAMFFLGSGALGATGTGDNTLFEIFPIASAVRGGVSGGIYSTARIDTLAWTGSGQTLDEANGLTVYAPTVSGVSSRAFPDAIHAIGAVLVTGDMGVTGTVDVGSLAGHGTTTVVTDNFGDLRNGTSSQNNTIAQWDYFWGPGTTYSLGHLGVVWLNTASENDASPPGQPWENGMALSGGSPTVPTAATLSCNSISMGLVNGVGVAEIFLDITQNGSLLGPSLTFVNGQTGYFSTTATGLSIAQNDTFGLLLSASFGTSGSGSGSVVFACKIRLFAP